MTAISWRTHDGVDWVVVPRSPAEPAVAEVHIDVGLADESVPDLGMISMVCAWLRNALADPQRSDDGGRPATSVVTMDLTELTLRFTGDPEAVASGLRRLDAVLEDLAIEVDDALRHRARTHPHPLDGWERHAAEQVGAIPLGVRQVALLAMGSIDRPALAGFVRRRVARAGSAAAGRSRGARWGCLTNEPTVLGTAGLYSRPERVVADDAPDVGGRAGSTGQGGDGVRRAGPACLPQVDPAQLLSLAVPDTPEAPIALTVVADALRGRLTRVQPLVACLDVLLHPLRSGPGLAIVRAPAAGRRSPEVPDAAASTLADLADHVDVRVIDSARRAWAAAHAADGEPELAAGRAVLRHWLAGGDRVLPAQLRTESLAVGDDAVRAALGELTSTTLLAVSASEQGSAPYPILEPGQPELPDGALFRSRFPTEPDLTCTETHLAVVRPGHGPRRRPRATIASVAFDDVVVRVDAGTSAVTLVDRHLTAVSVAWDLLLPGGEELRRTLERRTAGVPVVRTRISEDTVRQVAQAVTRQRRQAVWRRVRAAAVTACVIPLGVVMWQALSRPDPVHRDDVPWNEVVTLPIGSTLALTPAPEVRPARLPATSDRIMIAIKFCGGTSPGPTQDPRLLLDPADFSLQAPDGSTVPPSPIAVEGRRPPGVQYLAAGQCADGWLTYVRPGGQPDVGYQFRWSNSVGDRASWVLPPLPIQRAAV